MKSQLENFVYKALQEGADPKAIREGLIANEWEGGEVDAALSGYSGVAFGLPIPRPRPYASAAEAFLMLLMFALLYAASWSLGILLFQIVEYYFPRATPYFGRNSLGALRWSMAWLLVTFPLFLWLARKHYLVTRTDAVRKHSAIRKWLTYGTLLLAALTMLGDLVALFYNALAGELTIRFLLKVASLGVIAGGVFCYYLADLRHAGSRRQKSSARTAVTYVVAATAFSIAALVQAAFISGAPKGVRWKNQDLTRIHDLKALSASVSTYQEQKGQLPASLKNLNELELRASLALEGPSGDLYEYSVSDQCYTLCAVFDDQNRDREQDRRKRIAGFWAHSAGQHCFEFKVKNESAPP